MSMFRMKRRTEELRLSLWMYRCRGAEPDVDSAVRADVRRQNASLVGRDFYMDAWQTCTQCGEPYVFTTQEQRYWYEILRFYVWSYPVRCRRCRAVQRRAKRARQRYGDLREQAIRRDAPESLKREALAAIETWEAAGESLPGRTVQTRAILRRQIQRRRDAAAADSP
jgi:hypothetical protein